MMCFSSIGSISFFRIQQELFSVIFSGNFFVTFFASFAADFTFTMLIARGKVCLKLETRFDS